MSEYKIVQNGILISTNNAGVSLYKMTKDIINKYSNYINTKIQLIALSKLLKTEIAKIDIDCKAQFDEFQTKQIEFSRLHCYILSFNIDISISSRELYLASNKSEEFYFIKNIYIELYRFLERHNNEMGIIRKLIGASQEYKDYNKRLSVFRTNYYEQIKEYRHNLFAHYDKETQYEEFYESLNEIDTEEVAKMCLDFLTLQEELSIILENISIRLTNDSAIFNELILKKKEETDRIFKE